MSCHVLSNTWRTCAHASPEVERINWRTLQTDVLQTISRPNRRFWKRFRQPAERVSMYLMRRMDAAAMEWNNELDIAAQHVTRMSRGRMAPIEIVTWDMWRVRVNSMPNSPIILKMFFFCFFRLPDLIRFSSISGRVYLTREISKPHLAGPNVKRSYKVRSRRRILNSPSRNISA
jgi:hypothetical protein